MRLRPGCSPHARLTASLSPYLGQSLLESLPKHLFPVRFNPRRCVGQLNSLLPSVGGAVTVPVEEFLALIHGLQSNDWWRDSKPDHVRCLGLQQSFIELVVFPAKIAKPFLLVSCASLAPRLLFTNVFRVPRRSPLASCASSMAILAIVPSCIQVSLPVAFTSHMSHRLYACAAFTASPCVSNFATPRLAR